MDQVVLEVAVGLLLGILTLMGKALWDLRGVKREGYGATWAAQLSAVTTQVSILATQVSTVGAQLAGLTARVEASEANIERLRDRHEWIGATIGKLQVGLAELGYREGRGGAG